MIRLEQRLDDELEHLVHRTIGCCIEVHRALGPGLLEGIYRKAICLELCANGLLYETEKLIPVTSGEKLPAGVGAPRGHVDEFQCSGSPRWNEKDRLLN